MKFLKRLMTAEEMDQILDRIAGEIVQRHPDLERSALIGIRRRGVPLAQDLCGKIAALIGRRLCLGILDITLYRDDLSLVSPQPIVGESKLSFDVSGSLILLVDDVLFTGRTTRAALDSLNDYGRPRKVELVVLIDRDHRELPIQADYVGRQIETAEEDVVEVRIPPIDPEHGVFLTNRRLLAED